MILFRWSPILILMLCSSLAVAEERPLNLVAPWEITSLDPSRSGYIFTRMEVTETLMEVDDAGNPVPGLVSDWRISDDLTTWRFTLPEGVRFHDGSPLTAAAVAAGLETARNKPGMLQQAPITSIETDGNAVLVHLDQPFAPLWAVLAHTSTQILAPVSFDAEGNVIAVLGTGPYRVVTVEPPQRLVVERFEDYRGPAPEIADARYLAAGRGETRALMAESGDADLVFTLDAPSISRLSRNPRVDVHVAPIPRTISLKVNAGHPFLDSAEARRALSLAIDRAGIAAAILRFPEAAAAQLFPPGLGGWHVADLAPLGQDIEAARELLAGLGWQPGADGMLTRSGEAFRLTLRTFPDRPELPPIATAIQDQLRTIGIDLRVDIGNSSQIPAGHQDGSLELALLARNFSLIPDPLGTLLQDFGPGGGDWGAMNWSHPELTAHLNTLTRTTDTALQARLRTAVATLLQEELPVLPIAWYQHTAAASTRLSGVRIDPLERSYHLSRMRWSQ